MVKIIMRSGSCTNASDSNCYSFVDVVIKYDYESKECEMYPLSLGGETWPYLMLFTLSQQDCCYYFSCCY